MKYDSNERQETETILKVTVPSQPADSGGRVFKSMPIMNCQAHQVWQ